MLNKPIKLFILFGKSPNISKIKKKLSTYRVVATKDSF